MPASHPLEFDSHRCTGYSYYEEEAVVCEAVDAHDECAKPRFCRPEAAQCDGGCVYGVNATSYTSEGWGLDCECFGLDGITGECISATEALRPDVSFW